MKKLFFILLPLLLGIVVSCEKDKTYSKEDLPNESNIEVVDGRLKFSSNYSFKDYMESLDASGNINSPNILKSAKLKGFISLNLKNRDSYLKSLNSDESIIESDTLVPDQLLCSVLDTSRTIEIGNSIYKITQYGTFIIRPSAFEQIDSVLQGFENKVSLLTNIEGDLYKYSDSIYVFDTYHFISGDTINEDPIIVESTALKNGSLLKSTSSYDSDYNLTTVSWGAKTWLGKAWSWLIGGRDYAHTNNFDGNHRVRVNLYQYNYVFYAATGFSVKMQEWSGWWIFKTWNSAKAQKLVVGIEELKGHINGLSFDVFKQPTQAERLKTFSGVAAKMLYKGTHTNDLIAGWVDKIPMFHFDINVNIPLYGSLNYNDEQLLNSIKAGVDDAVLSELKTFIYNSANSLQSVQQNSPKIAFAPVPREGDLRVYLSGIKTYDNTSGENVVFGRSFGITVGWSSSGGFSVGGFTPFKFIIDDAKVFGAAY